MNGGSVLKAEQCDQRQTLLTTAGRVRGGRKERRVFEDGDAEGILGWFVM